MTFETLELLQIKYDTKMKKYKQLIQDYRAALNRDSSEYIKLNNKAHIPAIGFWLNVAGGQTIDTCKALCSSNSRCTGASYVPNMNLCLTVAGPGNIISYPGVDAFVPGLSKISKEIEDVNRELIQLNEQIRNAITMNPSNNLDQLYQDNSNMADTLIIDYNNLLNQRAEIRDLIVEYDNVNQNMEDTSLEVKQQMMNYNIYIIILVLILLSCVLFISNTNISILITSLIIALILFVLNMPFVSFIIVCGTILYSIM